MKISLCKLLLSSNLLKQGYLAERLKSSFRKFYGRYGDLIQQYEVSLSRMLNDILILDQQWLPNQSDFPPFSWHWYRAWPSPIMSGFHWAFATGVACQQGTLTHPDTWFRPALWDLLVLQSLRPDSSNLPCLNSTFHLEYPLVLSRFCLQWFKSCSKCQSERRHRWVTFRCLLVFQLFHKGYIHTFHKGYTSIQYTFHKGYIEYTFHKGYIEYTTISV